MVNPDSNLKSDVTRMEYMKINKIVKIILFFLENSKKIDPICSMLPTFLFSSNAQWGQESFVIKNC